MKTYDYIKNIRSLEEILGLKIGKANDILSDNLMIYGPILSVIDFRYSALSGGKISYLPFRRWLKINQGSSGIYNGKV